MISNESNDLASEVIERPLPGTEAFYNELQDPNLAERDRRVVQQEWSEEGFGEWACAMHREMDRLQQSRRNMACSQEGERPTDVEEDEITGGTPKEVLEGETASEGTQGELPEDAGGETLAQGETPESVECSGTPGTSTPTDIPSVHAQEMPPSLATESPSAAEDAQGDGPEPSAMVEDEEMRIGAAAPALVRGMAAPTTPEAKAMPKPTPKKRARKPTQNASAASKPAPKKAPKRAAPKKQPMKKVEQRDSSAADLKKNEHELWKKLHSATWQQLGSISPLEL